MPPPYIAVNAAAATAMEVRHLIVHRTRRNGLIKGANDAVIDRHINRIAVHGVLHINVVVLRRMRGGPHKVEIAGRREPPIAVIGRKRRRVDNDMRTVHPANRKAQKEKRAEIAAATHEEPEVHTIAHDDEHRHRNMRTCTNEHTLDMDDG